MNETWQNVNGDLLYYGLKPTSAQAYVNGLKSILRHIDKMTDADFRRINVTKPTLESAYDLAKLPLEDIEKITEHFIRSNVKVLSPKHLNVVFCSVKTWCVIKEVIKSTRMFKQIKFDKSSRKTSGLKEQMIETPQIRNGFKIATLDKKVVWGLYSLCGLRPSLIPQLCVKDIYETNYKLENGKLKFTVGTPLIIVDHNYQGNKGNIDFLIFLPSRLAEMVEMLVNSNGTVTANTSLTHADNKNEVAYIVRSIYSHPTIAFNGRPYLLRKYGDRVLDRITKEFNDEDQKEFHMGHKGKLSAVYQTGMSNEDEKRMRDQYEKACDSWINEAIFEMAPKEDIEKAKALNAMAQALGVTVDKLKTAMALLTTGKLSFEDYRKQITTLTKRAQTQRIKSEFEKMYVQMQTKHNKPSAQ